MHPADPSHQSLLRNWKPYLFLFIVAIVAYWPISFQLFSIKNDAIHYFLPVRYQISNSIRDGYFPYWSNTFYLGYPLHGDMQSGVWNPFVQLISLVTTYNVTVFHFETLFYIFLAGAGMYKLSGLFSTSLPVRLSIAASYMLSGYIVGSGEFINWLSSAAFIPYLIFYYHRFLHEPRTANALKTAVAAWLLLVCGYPADSIIIGYVLVGMCIYFFSSNRGKIFGIPGRVVKYIKLHALLIVATLLLLAPALLSYIDLLPYYSRGTGAGPAEAMINSFDPKSSISFISPWAAIATDFPAAGDVTGKNIFIGIYGFIFSVVAVFSRNNQCKKILLFAAITSFLFCLGDATPFRKICYDLIPGMNQFRHPSHFRLYTIIALLLLAAGTMDRFLKNEAGSTKKVRIAMMGTGLLLLLALVLTAFSARGLVTDIFSAFGNREAMRNFLQEITWKEMLLASCFIQLFFIAAWFYLTRNKRILSPRLFLGLFVLNLIINSVLALPATFVSKSSPAAINDLIREQTASYDLGNYNKPLIENSKDAFKYSNEIGLSFFYSGKPALTKVTNSPAFLSTMDAFVQTERLYEQVYRQPIAWLSTNEKPMADTILLSDTNFKRCSVTFPSETRFLPEIGPCDSIPGTASITNAAPGKFIVTVESVSPGQLNLSQAYHHYWRAYVGGNEVPVFPTNMAFMRINHPAGKSEVIWKYNPGIIKTAFTISLLTLGAIVVFFLTGLTKRRATHPPQFI